MNVGDKIREVLKEKKLTQRWLANQMDINEKTLSGKLSQGSLSAEDLLIIGSLLDYDLNKFKRESIFMLKYFNVNIITTDYDVLVLGKDKDEEYDLLYAKMEEMENNPRDELFKVVSGESLIYRVECESAVSEMIGFDLSKFCEGMKIFFQNHFDRSDEAECCGFSIRKGECLDELIEKLDAYEERIFQSESPLSETEIILKDILKQKLKERIKEFEEQIDNDKIVWG